jgi:hypothetical protein
MDYVAGQPLDRYLSKRGLPPRQIATLFARISEAVNAAHLLCRRYG